MTKEQDNIFASPLMLNNETLRRYVEAISITSRPKRRDVGPASKLQIRVPPPPITSSLVKTSQMERVLRLGHAQVIASA